MKHILTALGIFFTLPCLALDPTNFTITRITAPYFLVDGNSPATITKAYVGFEIKNNSNSGITYNGLKFSITSIGTTVVGQNYAVVSPASGIINVGTLAPGESKVCYFYVSYPANVTPQGTFNVQLSDNTASPKIQSFVIRNRSTISANAGGTATQSFTNQDILGGIIVDDVTYVVGNVQNGDESDFQVAVSSQFDPAKMTLLSTQVTASSVPGIPAGTTDSLYFVTGNGTNGATITMRWTFRITDYNFTNYLLPCAGATSGSTNYKYALNTSLGSGSPVTISSSANPLVITKTSDRSLYGASTTALFTITIQNPGAYGVTIDKIVDQVPTGFSFQSIDPSSQLTASNSTTVPVTGATGTISFEGGVVSGANTSYYIAAGGSLSLKYTAITSSSNASNLTTTVKDYIGTTEAGSAQNTVSVSTTLPVRLVSFSGNWVNNMVKLNWVSSNELNSSLFVIQRADGNGSFRQIGQVNASGSASSYFFMDSLPASGANYYRLKMIDRDLHETYSSILLLDKRQPGSFDFRVYPDPFVSTVNLQLTTETRQSVTIRVSDMQGRLLLQKQQVVQPGVSVISMDELGPCQNGLYILQVLTDHANYSRKLLKVQ